MTVYSPGVAGRVIRAILTLRFGTEERLMKASHPTEKKIRERAYGIYLQRGGAHGHDQDDWLQAEYELMQLPVRKIAEIKQPKTRKRRIRKSALVSLVHLAATVGTETLIHLRR